MNWARIESAYEWKKKEQEYLELYEESFSPCYAEHWERLIPPPEDSTDFDSLYACDPAETDQWPIEDDLSDAFGDDYWERISPQEETMFSGFSMASKPPESIWLLTDEENRIVEYCLECGCHPQDLNPR